MTSDTFAEFCMEMKTSPMLQISAVVRFVCREGHPMPHSAPIMWTAQSCSSPSVSTAPKQLTLAELPEQSNIRAFPILSSSNDDLIEEEGLLLRAADLIGQLGDPNYLKKANALFYEFEEIGLNKMLGYETPADVVYKYPQFYWSNVAPQIQVAIRYLNVTSSGRQWIANLYGNVFRAERELNLSGPQM